MFKPDISGIIVAAPGKHGNLELRYRVDTTSNRVTYIIKQARVGDLLYTDYATARKQFDAICEDLKILSSRGDGMSEQGE